MDKKNILKLENLLLTGLNNKVFPCAAVAFSQWKGQKYERYITHCGYSQLTPVKKKLEDNNFFDLASLTKPLATVLVLLYLFENKSLQLTTALDEIYPSCPVDKKKITIKDLMSHSSGLPAHREYFNELYHYPEAVRKEKLLTNIFAEKLDTEPGTNHCYSDLGFILLGFIIEKITGRSLDYMADKFIYSPLQLQKDLFFGGMDKYRGKAYVSTENCLWGHKMLCGRVHDDNCRVIGGVAGHAGLFGNIRGILHLCEELLNQWQGRGHHPAYSNSLLKRIMTPVNGSTWTLGFDTPSPQGSSSGRFFSKRSVGHLGFTGTSFWIDLERECVAVLLTNRVHPDRRNDKIRQFRPLLHDVLMETAVTLTK